MCVCEFACSVEKICQMHFQLNLRIAKRTEENRLPRRTRKGKSVGENRRKEFQE